MSFIGNPWTFATSYIEMYFGDQKLSSGSGFFWTHAEKIFLVSNWHNFSGLNPSTDQPISNTGGRPDRLIFTCFRKDGDEDKSGFYSLSVVPKKAVLCEFDFSRPRWLEHPRLGRAVDIAVIDVSEVVRGLQINCVNVIEADAVLESTPSQEVFILGFPLGLLSNVPTPIWKKGSVATEPSYDPNGVPCIYVDTASRSGMSGSVVIARHVVVGTHVTMKDGANTQPYLYAIKDVVLGVYSGRLGADEFKAQLGIVWKRNVLEETIKNGVAPRI